MSKAQYYLSTLVVTAGLFACASPVDQRALDGVHALDACDVRAANTAFSEAHDMDPTRGDVALAFALTDLGILAEDPALTAIAPRLGFDRPIDTSVLWGHDGVLDRLSQHAACDSVSNTFQAQLPHPSARPMGPDFWTTVDPTLTLGDLRTAMVAISPRLHRIALALEQAASSMGSDGVTLSGGCGIGSTPTRIQPPELLALAAGLEAIRAVTQMTLAYDGALPFATLLSPNATAAERVAGFNAHLLRPTDASQLEAGRKILEDVASLSSQAVAAARAITTHRSDAVFDWTALPPQVLDDVDSFATAATAALPSNATAVTPIPRLSPALGLRIGSFFTDAYDLGSQGPLWSLSEPDLGGTSYSMFDSDRFQATIVPRFDSNPFDSSAPSRSFDIDWSFDGDPFGATFDPGHRWTDGFSCTSSTSGP